MSFVRCRRPAVRYDCDVRIALDASVLALPCPTGVERTAAEQVRALAGVLGPRDELVLLARERLPRFEGIHRRVRTVGLGGSEPLAIWRETRLAPALRRLGSEVCWSPVSAIPMRTDVPRVASVWELPWRVVPALEGRTRERVQRVRLALADRGAARIVVPSEFTRGHVAATRPGTEDRLRLVPLGVDERFSALPDASSCSRERALRGVERLSRRQHPSGGYVLHVGGDRPRKDVPYLMAAHVARRARDENAALVLAGPPAPRDPPPGAVALGYVRESLLLALYEGAGALAVTSVTEGFGLPVLEGLAAGVPVVARDAGAVREVAGGRARLVDGGPDEFAEALDEALADPRRDELAVRGRAHAATYPWERSARALLDVLREAAETA